MLFAALALAALAIAAALFALLSSGGGGGKRAAYRASRGVFLDNISVDGISLAGMSYNEAWEAVTRRAEAWQDSWSLSVSCDGFTYATLNYAAVGMQTDYEKIDAMLQEAWALGHTDGYEGYLRDVEALAETPYNAYLSPAQGDNDQVSYLLNVVYNSVYRAPQDAAVLLFDPTKPDDPFTFQTDAAGRTIDKEKARADILERAATGQGGTYEIELIPIAPAVTLEQARSTVSLLSTGTTAIDKHSTDDRNANIELAFSRINGMVLENGDTFRFNSVVGKRSEKNGFKVALGYLFGELVDTVGGGVCQASTTIYSAALCAGMTIKSRTAHSIPVSYISLGQDATVNDAKGHEIDLVFTNETGGTVYITCGVEKNASGRLECVARFYGQALPDGAYYRLESVITEVLEPPEDEIRADKDGKYVKYTNQKYKYSSASEGYVVTTYLQKCIKGEVVEEKALKPDTYKARPAIYYVGVTER
ncbi:MAG: VanW family protein [Clostridia bacterium]|nr:VanW family protein [Clostridia bacterium]